MTQIVFQLDTITIGLWTIEEPCPSDSSPCCDYISDLLYINYAHSNQLWSPHVSMYMFILIFTGDEVYLMNEDERYEYVLNTSGSIWKGTYNNFFGGPWQFDQVSSRVSSFKFLPLATSKKHHLLPWFSVLSITCSLSPELHSLPSLPTHLSLLLNLVLITFL